MKDKDIRPLLLQLLLEKNQDENQYKIVEEMPICQGDAIVDVAVISSTLHGYEIKSEKDTLSRLDSQQSSYNQTFDYITIVLAKKHLNNARKRIPSWWGILLAEYSEDKLTLRKVRTPKKNTSVCKKTMTQLLWKSETIDILKHEASAKELNKYTRRALWQRASELYNKSELLALITGTLISRKNWRIAAHKVDYAIVNSSRTTAT